MKAKSLVSLCSNFPICHRIYVYIVYKHIVYISNSLMFYIQAKQNCIQQQIIIIHYYEILFSGLSKLDTAIFFPNSDVSNRNQAVVNVVVEPAVDEKDKDPTVGAEDQGQEIGAVEEAGSTSGNEYII